MHRAVALAQSFPTLAKVDTIGHLCRGSHDLHLCSSLPVQYHKFHTLPTHYHRHRYRTQRVIQNEDKNALHSIDWFLLCLPNIASHTHSLWSQQVRAPFLSPSPNNLRHFSSSPLCNKIVVSRHGPRIPVFSPSPSVHSF